MRRTRARGVLGIGLSGAVWAAVTLHPTALARDGAPAPEPVADRTLTEGPLADVYREVEARIREGAPAMEADARAQLAATIVEEASAAELDPLLVVAVIEVESGFQPQVLSSAGAKGLMQMLDVTLRTEIARSGIVGDPADPIVQVRAGVRYLRRLIDAFHHEDNALMAYYAGPVKILGYLRVGEIPDRYRVYPRRVKAVQRRLQRAAGPRAVVADQQQTADSAGVMAE